MHQKYQMVIKLSTIIVLLYMKPFLELSQCRTPKDYKIIQVRTFTQGLCVAGAWRTLHCFIGEMFGCMGIYG